MSVFMLFLALEYVFMLPLDSGNDPEPSNGIQILHNR
jgi:hypothetical protein